MLRSLVRNVPTEAKEAKLAADMDGEAPGRYTVGTYLDALRRIFVVEDRLSPQHLDREVVEGAVGGYECERFDLGLSGEHSVEGIAV